MLHLKGKNTINLEEIFEGFSKKKQKFHEDYLIENGVDETHIEASKRRTKNWSKERWLSHKSDCDEVHEELIRAIRDGLSVKSKIAQDIIDKHFKITSRFWTPDQKSYAALADTYGAHPDFVKFYEELDPKLLTFLQKAMKLYAKKSLS